MTAEASGERAKAGGRGQRSAWLALGGVLAAIGASSCCVLPFALFALGVGGAWIGSLTALAPYQPIFLVVGLLCVGAGLVSVYHSGPRKACAPDQACGRPAPRRLTKLALWTAAGLIASVLIFPFVAPLFLTT